MIYCKRIISTILCVVLVLCMAACEGTTSNGLMQDASPSTSALALYTYNGEKVSRMFIFDSDTTQILDELDAVRATETERWSLDDITLPIYGLEIGSRTVQVYLQHGLTAIGFLRMKRYIVLILILQG